MLAITRVPSISVSRQNANFKSSSRARTIVVRHAVFQDSSEQSTVSPQPTIHIRFMLPLSVNFGDSLVLCGASQELGCWDPASAPQFSWTSPDVWILDAELPASTMTEFKVVHVTANGEYIWEYTKNRIIDVPSMEMMKDGEVTLAWCDESADMVRPRILSSLASWEEEDGSMQGGSSMPFGGLFGFMSASEDEVVSKQESVTETPDVAEDGEVVDQATVETSVGKSVDGGDIEDIAEIEEEVCTEVVEAVEAVTETTSDVTVDEPPTTATAIATDGDALSKETKKNAATARALKNVTTAGVVLAGIGGAAALAGIAFDAALVDTAMMGLAVAAGGAAMSSPQASKKEKDAGATPKVEEIGEEAGETEAQTEDT